jgi:hypothetical protein
MEMQNVLCLAGQTFLKGKGGSLLGKAGGWIIGEIR